MQTLGNDENVLYEPDRPTLEDAQSRINRDIWDVENKLRDGIQRGAPPEYISKGEVILAELQSETPEARLAKLMEGYEQRLTAYRNQQLNGFIARIGQRYANCRMDSFVASSAAQRSVLESLKVYGNKLAENVAQGVGVVLHGPCGTGKDHLLVALSRIAIAEHGLRIHWASGTTLRDRGRATDHDVLYLSDPAPPGGLDSQGGYQTREAANRLYEWIDEFYRHHKPIWMSVNAANRDAAVDQLGAQIVDRVTHSAIVLECNWPSHRKPFSVVRGGEQ